MTMMAQHFCAFGVRMSMCSWLKCGQVPSVHLGRRIRIVKKLNDVLHWYDLDQVWNTLWLAVMLLHRKP